MTTRLRTLVTAAAAVISLAAIAALSGCTDKQQDIDTTLVGGTVQTEDSDYNVDIRHATEEADATIKTEDSPAPVNSDTIADISTAEPAIIDESDIPKEENTSPAADENDVPEAPAVGEDKPATTKPADTTKPAVTITTDKPKVTTPAQTVRTDLPKVTAEPQYTTKATTPAKPAQTEPTDVKLDSNGFPANPVGGQKFTDSNGTTYQYNDLMGAWFESGGVSMQEFPDNYEGGVFGGETILH